MNKKSFIRAIEYWVPVADGSILEFAGGLFGGASRFAALSRQLCFGRGEGLPGQAWDAGHPVMLKELDGATFRRADAAKAQGFTCAIALPLYAGARLSAVLIIFCGDDQEHAGAIELWRNKPSASRDMTLVDGYYGSTGDTFEFISRSTSFRRGVGLPGMTWEQQGPVFLQNLGKGSGFLRADSAVRVGINRGFAIPCPAQDGSNYVLAFLSALATPIACRVEVWEPAANQPHLKRSFGFCETDGLLDNAAMAPLSGAGVGPVGRAFASGLPVAIEPMIAIPVGPQGRVSAVVAMHL